MKFCNKFIRGVGARFLLMFLFGLSCVTALQAEEMERRTSYPEDLNSQDLLIERVRAGKFNTKNEPFEEKVVDNKVEAETISKANAAIEKREVKAKGLELDPIVKQRPSRTNLQEQKVKRNIRRSQKVNERASKPASINSFRSIVGFKKGFADNQAIQSQLDKYYRIKLILRRKGSLSIDQMLGLLNQSKDKVSMASMKVSEIQELTRLELLQRDVIKQEINNMLDIKDSEKHFITQKLPQYKNVNNKFQQFEDENVLNSYNAHVGYSVDSMHKLRQYEYYQLLFHAINNDDLKAMSSLVKNFDINLDSIFSGEDTVLTYAIKHGSEDALRLLVRMGASLYQRNFAGFVPVEVAYNIGRYEMIDELVYLMERVN